MKVSHLTPESIGMLRDSLFVKGKSSLTVNAYSADLTGLLNWIRTSKPTCQSLEVAASLYLNETRNSVAPKTTLRRITSFRCYGKLFGEPAFLAEYSGPIPARPKPHPIPEGIEAIRRMIDYTAHPHVRALIAMMGLIGLRVSEARSIRPENFNTSDMTLTVRGKGDKSRTVPVSDEAWAAIQDAFFEAVRDGGPLVNLSDSAARRAYTAAGKRASVSRHTSSHDARATLATAALNNGANIRVVQEILGHASVTSTEVYTGVTEKQMRTGLTFA